MKSRLLLIALGMLLGIAMAVFYGFVCKPIATALDNQPLAQDAERGNILVKYLVSRFPFITPADDNALSTMYTDPVRNGLGLFIYGVTNSEGEGEIISAVRDWQSTNSSLKAISIRFYGRANGRSQYGKLLPNEPLCVVSVELPQ